MDFKLRQKLGSMRYKNFVWDYNPSTCSYSCDRTYASHKYPGISGVELEDMGVGGVIITGKGEFFGPDAYSNWMKLNTEYKTPGAGTFYHPIFTDITRGLMTKLQADMEPRDDYVLYSFEIVGDTAMDNINTPIKVANNNQESESSRQPKVGDIVILTGYAYYTSYGNTPRSAYKNGVKYTVTYTNYKGSHPIHCGSLGWARLQDVKLVNANTGSNTNDVVYVVKSGDTLSGICARYGANWKDVAAYNNLNNPHLIYVGDKIKIPQSMITK